MTGWRLKTPKKTPRVWKCPAPKCDRHRRPEQVACRDHWYQLPMELRRELWAAYKVHDRAGLVRGMREAVQVWTELAA